MTGDEVKRRALARAAIEAEREAIDQKLEEGGFDLLPEDRRALMAVVEEFLAAEIPAEPEKIAAWLRARAPQLAAKLQEQAVIRHLETLAGEILDKESRAGRMLQLPNGRYRRVWPS